MYAQIQTSSGQFLGRRSIRLDYDVLDPIVDKS